MGIGRPAGIYLPLPYCKNGHKRTTKNTRWRRFRLYGKYEYLTARCAICEVIAQHQRKAYHNRFSNRDRSKAAAADTAADPQPPS